MVRARWASVVLVALVLAGCAAPPSADPAAPAGAAARDGPLISGSLGDFDALREEAHQPARRRDLARAVVDPDAPAVTMNGTPSFAIALLVRETWTARDGSMEERHPCGGVVVAVPAGWPDPRAHFGAFEHDPEGNATVVDERGRAWLTQRYVAKANASAFLWAQHVGGGTEFVADSGGHCAAPMYEEGPLNVLIHVEGPERVDLWYHPAQALPPALGPVVPKD